MADQIITQGSFAAGIHRGRSGPEDSVHDAINALITDDRKLRRRGGTSYYGDTAASAALIGLSVGQYVSGTKVLATSSNKLFWVLTLGAPVAIADFAAISGGSTLGRLRPVGAGVTTLHPYLAASGQVHLLQYAGSEKLADYSTGTVDVTEDSATVTGTGTVWLSNVDPGMILTIGSVRQVVLSVESDTSLTLAGPWDGATASGQAYALYRYVAIDTPVKSSVSYTAAVGSPQRVLVSDRNKVYFSAPGNPHSWDASLYHELPASAQIIGMDSLGDTAFVFTTAGVWTISNMNYDPLDDAGNIQHTVSQISQSIILLSDTGLAGWGGGLVVPAIDDIYLLGPDGSINAIGEGIRPLYRDYADTGTIGPTAVYRGHLLMPMFDPATPGTIDTLVCRMGMGWTRWHDHAAGFAYAVKTGTDAREPRLYGIGGQRVTDLSGCFEPDAARDDDADGTDHQMIVETRDYDLLGTGEKPGTAEKAELVYELDGTGATMGLEWAAGEEGAAYTALTPVRGGVESDGLDRSVWRIGKARHAVRLRITQAGAAAEAILHRVTLRVRRSGR